MMQAKEILAQIKQVFNDLTAPVAAAAPEVAPAAPKEYEIKGGGMVMIDKLEAGGIVMIDGSPALVGELELADGTKLTIGDNGVISAIEMGASAEPTLEAPAASEDMGAKFTAFENSTNEKFTAYETKLSAYEQRFAANETQLGEYKAELGKHKEMIEKLLQFGKLMVEAPAAPADPAAKVGNNFAEIDTDKIKASSILFN
jgi:hypothetical protein